MRITHNPNDINNTEWSALALRSPFSSAFQTPESHMLYASCPEFTTFFTAVTDTGNRIKGIISGAIHKTGPMLFNLLTRRAIVFGGPLLATDITEEELLALLDATVSLLRHKTIYLEFRFTEDYSRHNNIFQKAHIKLYPALDAIIDTSSHETIAKNIQKRKHCQIRSALRNKIETIEKPTKQEIASFYPRLKKLHWNASHKPIPSLDFFLKLSETPIGMVSLLKYEGEIIGMDAAFVLAGRKLYLLYSICEKHNYKHLAPSSVSLYVLLHRAVERRIPLCDLMGAGVPSKPYGVRDFKIRMGACTPDYQRARIAFRPLVYRLASLLFRKYE